MFQRPKVRAAIAVSLGAIVGALSRYYLGLWFGELVGSDLPIATLVANLVGCFLMGAIVTMAVRNLLSNPDLLLLLTTGFLGSLTTFSSYELDAVKLLDNRNFFAGFLYWAGSPLLGFLGIMLGIALVKKITPTV